MHIGVDIGGTFTDIVALDAEGRLTLDEGPQHAAGTSSTVSATPCDAVLARSRARDPRGVERFIHGTTVATNAILEHKGALTALLMTEGFEDVLELGRQKRSRMYDLGDGPGDADLHRPAPAPDRRPRAARRARPRARPARRGRRARGGHAGSARRGSQAVAVCYLFSFVNPAHERRTRELLREVAPEISVSLSSEVDPDLSRVRAHLRDGVRRLPRPGGEALSRRAGRHAARRSASPACR